jgi:hypothetical protein
MPRVLLATAVVSLGTLVGAVRLKSRVVASTIFATMESAVPMVPACVVLDTWVTGARREHVIHNVSMVVTAMTATVAAHMDLEEVVVKEW